MQLYLYYFYSGSTEATSCDHSLLVGHSWLTVVNVGALEGVIADGALERVSAVEAAAAGVLQGVVVDGEPHMCAVKDQPRAAVYCYKLWAQQGLPSANPQRENRRGCPQTQFVQSSASAPPHASASGVQPGLYAW